MPSFLEILRSIPGGQQIQLLGEHRGSIQKVSQSTPSGDCTYPGEQPAQMPPRWRTYRCPFLPLLQDHEMCVVPQGLEELLCVHHSAILLQHQGDQLAGDHQRIQGLGQTEHTSVTRWSDSVWTHQWHLLSHGPRSVGWLCGCKW